MDIARVHTLVETHHAATAVDAERAVLTNGLAECHRLAGWVEGQKVNDRAAVAGAMPELGDALAQGDINTHLDYRHGFV